MNKIITEDLDFILASPIDWEKFRDKTVLVTGAYGTLLSYVTYTLLRLNEQGFNVTVIALIRNAEKARKIFGRFVASPHLKLFVHDLATPVELPDQIDYIIHGAGYGDPQNFVTNSTGVIIPNVIGTYHLLEFARTKKIKGFLFFSSGAVYGTPLHGEEVTEKYQGILDQLDVKNCYGESKRMAENLCRVWYEQYGIPTKMVRPVHIYGPTMDIDHDSRVVASFVKNVVSGQNIVMKSDGTAKRPFCYIADATTGFFKVLLDGVPGEAYNVGSDEAIVSIRELAEIVVAVFPDKKLRVIQETADQANATVRAYQMFMSSKKLEALGWKPSFSVREGIIRTVQSFLKH